MILNFRMVSDEVDKFKREIRIDGDATFLDLRNAICDSVGYDKDQMCSVFLCDSNWEKQREITLEDMGFDTSQDSYLMDECVLRDFIEDEGQKLIFVFDYFTDRSFFLEMKKLEPRKTLLEPVCSLSLGNPPAQNVDLDDFDAKIDAKAAQQSKATIPEPEDLGEEFYGTTEFNDDEFNLSDFEDLDLND